MSRLGRWLLLALAPWALYLALQSVVNGWLGLPPSAILRVAPAWSDEVMYWHQAATFAHAGLDGGYYTQDEQPAAASWSRWYAWGAFVPISYGLAALLGWPLAGIVLVNLLLYALALALYVAWVRPTERQMLPLLLSLLACIPLHLAWLASMQELAHFALAVALAGGFVALLRSRSSGEDWPRLLFGLMLGLIVVGALWRPTWGIFSLPLFWLTLRPWSLRGALLSGVVAVLLTLGLSLLYDFSAAPYASYRATYLAQNQLSGLSGLLAYLGHNLGQLWDGRYGLAVGQRVQVLGGILLSGLALLGGLLRQRRLSAEWLFHLFNLGGVSLLILTLHQVASGHDYRILGPHLLLSALVWVGTRRSGAALALAASMLLLLPWAIEGFQNVGPNLGGQVQAEQARWREPLAAHLAYRPDADPWCNTVSVSARYIQDFVGEPGLLLAIPPGLGISFLTPGYPLDAPRAAYLLLNEADTARAALPAAVRLLDVPDGALYANPAAACP